MRIASLFSKNLASSFIVFLVALPLCLGIAIASGVTPEKGIISGAIGGVVVGLLGGGSLAVSGPANSLIVVLGDMTKNFNLEHMAAATVIAGFLQIFAGSISLGRITHYIPAAVSRGLLIGLAIIVIKSQFGAVLDGAHETMNFTSHGALIGIGSLFMLFLIQAIPTEMRPRWLRLTPPALLVTAMAILITAAFDLSVKRVHVPDSVLDDFTFLSLSTINWLNTDILMSAVTLFLLASMESLLNAKAVDELAAGHKTDPDREMFAQGVGNILCGILCAIPIAGVVIRSSANINAGATSRLSTILHGVWLLIMASCFPFLLDKIPLATLSAVLVFAAWNLIQPANLWKLAKNMPSDALKIKLTALLVCLVDVATGVGAGIIMNLAINNPKLKLMVAPTQRSVAKWWRRLQPD